MVLYSREEYAYSHLWVVSRLQEVRLPQAGEDPEDSEDWGFQALRGFVSSGEESGRAGIHSRPAPGLWLLMTERWNGVLSRFLLFNLGTGQRNRKPFLLAFPFLISLIIMGPNVEGK